MTRGTRTVIASWNLDGDLRCVDLFRRADGSFGFEEYRRDPEDGRGWFAIGGHRAAAYGSAEAAEAAARNAVPWLAQILDERRG